MCKIDDSCSSNVQLVWWLCTELFQAGSKRAS